MNLKEDFKLMFQRLERLERLERLKPLEQLELSTLELDCSGSLEIQPYS